MPEVLDTRYELDEVIVRGGITVVYRGRDTWLDRIVAVKRPRADLARDQAFRARFRSEVQSVASLNHPSVVSVYDIGESVVDSIPIPYVVMEYVDGRTLRELLRDEHSLLPESALKIIDGVLRALDYSHSNGIVHRDIRSANVMLTRSGDVKVVGFGSVRALDDNEGDTTNPQVIGSADCLSPEQARGERVDGRSDLYSTGCLLYELLTGRLPFIGDSPIAVAYQHVRENPVPPSQLHPEIPRWADSIVLKAMAKNPADRYQNAAEMRADIQRVLVGRIPRASVHRTLLRGGAEEVFAYLVDQGPRFWLGYKEYKEARAKGVQAQPVVAPEGGAFEEEVFADLAEQGTQFRLDYKKYQLSRNESPRARPERRATPPSQINRQSQQVFDSSRKPPPGKRVRQSDSPARLEKSYASRSVRTKRPRSHAGENDDPVSVAVRAALKPGLLTFNPPPVMMQGQWERVEVGIARSAEFREALTVGLRGRGEPQFEPINTSSVMGVELSGPAFMVRSFSPAEQLVPQTARWEFDVRPVRAGRQTLTLCVSMRIDSPLTGHIAVPVLERDIRIRVAVGFSARRFLVENWQWLIATGLGIGGVIAAWATLFH